MAAWLVASAVLILVGLNPVAAVVVAGVAVVLPKILIPPSIDVQVVRGRRWP